MFGPARPRRSRAFTLLELLVVIGIIALLATILLTVVSRARESGRRTVCMNNLKTIAHAVILYVNDNDGFFPFAAAKVSDDPRINTMAGPDGHMSADWIYWQSSTNDKLPPNSDPPPQWNGLVIDNVERAGIGKYLGGCTDQTLNGLQMLRCPSDQRVNNSVMGNSTPGMGYPAAGTGSAYPFSYVLNALMCSGNFSTNGAANLAQPPNQYIAKTLAKVKDPGSKILVYEEDPRTIDDGNGVLIPIRGTGTNLLSIRHNGPEIDDPSTAGLNDIRDPDTVTFPQTNNPTPDQLTMSNSGSQGNVAFCDGHAEVIPRLNAHLKDHWAPDPTMFPMYP
jgi:prepilin-type N-terminal cleavage/methylation domain-containing protein/prepilin-type processing-associated H-X9-DG protein